jgi:hypothetical protein
VKVDVKGAVLKRAKAAREAWRKRTKSTTPRIAFLAERKTWCAETVDRVGVM